MLVILRLPWITATKQYVDNATPDLSSVLATTGGTLTGDIQLGSGGVGGGGATVTRPYNFIVDFGENYENISVTMSATSVTTFYGKQHPGDPGSNHVVLTIGVPSDRQLLV